LLGAEIELPDPPTAEVLERVTTTCTAVAFLPEEIDLWVLTADAEALLLTPAFLNQIIPAAAFTSEEKF
jgi:hypothetical protein